MDEDAGAFDVLQEVQAEAGAFRSAFDEPRNIRHDETGVVHGYDAQVRRDGREVIIRDLGVGAGGYGQQRGFAHVGIAHEAHVRDQLELQLDLPFPGKSAGFGEIRRLADGILEHDVAFSASAAFGCHEGLAVLRQVCHDRVAFSVAHHGADGNLDDQIRAVLAELLAASAVFSALRLVFSFITEIHQGAQVAVGLDDDVAAFAAVSAVRTALRNIGFPAEGHGTVSALARLDEDRCLIYKHEFPLRKSKASGIARGL